jgi:release factor glutamine methyltransferase
MPSPTRLAGLIQRRMTGESVARIIGEREFYGLAFTLSPANARTAPGYRIAGRSGPRARCLLSVVGILDLGTGTGCIPDCYPGQPARMHPRWPPVDLIADALVTRRKHNAQRHGVDGPA